MSKLDAYWQDGKEGTKPLEQFLRDHPDDREEVADLIEILLRPPADILRANLQDIIEPDIERAEIDKIVAETGKIYNQYFPYILLQQNEFGNHQKSKFFAEAMTKFKSDIYRHSKVSVTEAIAKGLSGKTNEELSVLLMVADNQVEKDKVVAEVVKRTKKTSKELDDIWEEIDAEFYPLIRVKRMFKKMFGLA